MTDLQTYRIQIGYFNQIFSAFRNRCLKNSTKFKLFIKRQKRPLRIIPFVHKMTKNQTYNEKISYLDRIYRISGIISTKYSIKVRPIKWKMKNVLFMISRLTIFCLTSLLLFNQIFSLCSIVVKKSDLNGQNSALIHKNVPCFSKSDEICLSQNERLSHCTIGLLTPNRYAKITYGNKSDSKKGLKNLHLNIRSLKNKVSEVKNIIKAEKPHIFGLSECEMRKSKNVSIEKQLKISGYNLLLPKSWEFNDTARLVVYIKSSLEYEQVKDLENESVQSIWVKAGFKNSRKVLFCHAYREHANSLGYSLRSQRDSLECFLSQWDLASDMKIGGEPSEVHIMGDMNLDAWNKKWFDQDYHLSSLAKMVHLACEQGSFSQIVNVPTRYQFNSVTGRTSISCLDHVYTNKVYRCSEVTVKSFGNSDHELLGYIRYSKEPTVSARTIRKRSYKNFVLNNFLEELRTVDWTPVYSCLDIDNAVYIFTELFKTVLDNHAPWIIFQKRKHYKPWITEETVNLMKSRDIAKSEASVLAKAGANSAEAWSKYKRLRNNVNNRLKFEESNFKLEKINASLDSPSKCWSTAKEFMDWKSCAGPPNQLIVGNTLITKASEIAK